MLRVWGSSPRVNKTWEVLREDRLHHPPHDPERDEAVKKKRRCLSILHPKGEKTSFLKYSQFGERLPGGVGRRHMVLKCLGVVRQRSAEVVRGEDPLELWDDG